LTTYKRIRVKTALTRSGLYDLDYALNPYAGCAHGCLYCYAKYYTRYPEVSQNWGRLVYVKENLLEALKRDLARLKLGVVGVSTITDPYQPIEREEVLTRRAIELLLAAGFEVSVQTKSDLVVRDLDVFSRYKERVDVGFTITSLNVEVASLLEPGAPPPERRIQALKAVSAEGVETWVFLGPIIPGYNDDVETIKEVVKVAAETGSTLLYDYLRLKPGIIEMISRSIPSLAPLLGRVRSRKWRLDVSRRVERICEELEVKFSPAFPWKERKDREISEYF